MWQGFNLSVIIFMLLFTLNGQAQPQQKVVYNLQQNWEHYNPFNQGFLPAIGQTKTNAIYFNLDIQKYGNYTLYIYSPQKQYLFYQNKLLTTMSKGSHFYNIDSLGKTLGHTLPKLTIYSRVATTEMQTLIVDGSFKAAKIANVQSHKRVKSFTTYLIFATLLLLLWLIFIKFKHHDIYEQYTHVFRAFNLTTTDELIYKGRFFVAPGVHMLTWMSFAAAFILYYIIFKLDIHYLGITWSQPDTVSFHFWHLVLLAFGFMALFIVRYVLVATMAYVFDMQTTRNIHFATHLRLTFYLLLLLLSIVVVDYFLAIPAGGAFLLTVTFGFLFLIILLIGARLSFMVRHSFVQIILYLCATEIFLFVFVYKLVVG